jgi:hypothetical protein
MSVLIIGVNRTLNFVLLHRHLLIFISNKIKSYIIKNHNFSQQNVEL